MVDIIPFGVIHKKGGPIIRSWNKSIWGQSYTIHFTEFTWDEPLYILDLKSVYGPDFPGETLRLLKAKEEKKFGEYCTKRRVLKASDAMGLP